MNYRKFWIVAGVVVCGCTDSKSASLPPTEMSIDFARQLNVEESQQVINVAPRVSFDPQGGFLAADFREAQIRRYGPDGALVWHSGRQGKGPGEYERASRVVRLPNGEVMAVDHMRRAVIYAADGKTISKTLTQNFDGIEDLDVINDSLVLVSARLGRDTTSARLHVWNIRTNEIVRSFFKPWPSVRNRFIATTAGWASAAIRGDSAVAVFSVLDSVYVFSLNGDLIRAIGLRVPHLRRVPAKTPVEDRTPMTLARHFTTFDLVSGVYWLSDRRILVQFFSDLPANRGQVFNLALLSQNGELQSELLQTPRLLAVHPETDSLLFISPNAEVPNQWTLGSLR